MAREQTNSISMTVSSSCKKKTEEKRSFWRINKEMLPYKLHFFLFVGGMGALLPYQSAFAITKFGLTASNLAAAYTSQQFLFIVLKPLIGYVADYLNRLKAVIIGLTTIQGVLWFIILFFPAPNISVSKETKEWTSSNRNNTTCNLCKDIEKYTYNFGSNQSSSSEDLIFNGTEETRYVDCLSQQNNYTLKIREKNCCANPSESSSLNSSLEKKVSSIVVSQNGVMLSNIICILPAGKSWETVSTTIGSMKDSCYSLNADTSMNPSNTSRNVTLTSWCLMTKKELSKAEYNMAVTSANFKSYQFWIFVVILIISNTCISCVFTMSDTALHESIQDKKADYGQQRLFGALSWGLLAPISGLINDYTDGYFASWGIMVFFCCLQFLNLKRMNLAKPDFSQNIFKDLKNILSSKDFLFFDVGVLLNGMATGIVWFYLNWFILYVHGSRLHIGLANAVQCYLGEAPFMFFSGIIIKKIGFFNVVSLALLTSGVRFVLYGFVYNPWWIMPIEISHGLTFGVFYSAMTSFGKMSSKPGTEATTQSVLCSTYEGLGAGLGSVIAGICLDLFGGHTTFFYAGLAFIFASAVNLCFTVLLRCRGKSLVVTKVETSEKNRF